MSKKFSKASFVRKTGQIGLRKDTTARVNTYSLPPCRGFFSAPSDHHVSFICSHTASHMSSAVSKGSTNVRARYHHHHISCRSNSSQDMAVPRAHCSKNAANVSFPPKILLFSGSLLKEFYVSSN
jgi:hypothetical protein